jgi:hypothetical protein
MLSNTYNEIKAKEVEAAVMQVFNCKLSEVIGVIDTRYKKIAVFVLHKLLGYDKRNIAQAYSMSYLYVPTVVDEVEILFLLDPAVRQKISEVTKIIGYVSPKMETTRNYVA